MGIDEPDCHHRALNSATRILGSGAQSASFHFPIPSPLRNRPHDFAALFCA